MLALLIGTVGAAAGRDRWSALIALRRTGIYFAMITVAIAEMFFFLEILAARALDRRRERPARRADAELRTRSASSYQVGTGWSMYGFLAVCYFIGIVIALRIVRSPVGADPERDPRQPAAGAARSATRSAATS